MKELIQVRHEELKAELEREKAGKIARKAKKKPSAEDRNSGIKGSE